MTENKELNPYTEALRMIDEYGWTKSPSLPWRPPRPICMGIALIQAGVQNCSRLYAIILQDFPWIKEESIVLFNDDPGVTEEHVRYTLRRAEAIWNESGSGKA